MAVAKTIGRYCLAGKCVWRRTVVWLPVFAVRLVFRDYFSVDVFRRYVSISKRDAYAFSSRLRRAVEWYAIRRANGKTHEAAFSEALRLVPRVVREDKRALGYLEDRVKRIVDEAERIVEVFGHRAPASGWSVVAGEEDGLPVLPAAYLPGAVQYALRFPAPLTELVFCSQDTCLPVPRGLWPGTNWAQFLFLSLRNDIYYMFIERFGAVTVLEYLSNLEDVDEFAVSIRLGRRWTRVTLFIPVSDPARHAGRVAEMQELAVKTLKLVEAEVLADGAQAQVDGLEYFGVSEEKLRELVSRLLGK